MLVQELVKQNQEKEEKEERVLAEVESLRKETEELRKTVQAWRQEQLAKEEVKDQGQKAFQSAVHEEHRKHSIAVQEVQAVLKDKEKRPSYSEATKAPATRQEQP